MSKTISYNDFATIDIKMNQAKKQTVTEILDKLVELTRTDPTSYNIQGNRSRLLLIRGHVQELKGRKL